MLIPRVNDRIDVYLARGMKVSVLVLFTHF